MIAACHGPSETGAHGMVGRLVDASGSPVQGVVVNSVEAEARTDAQGAFAVSWKEPDTTVIFQHGAAIWQRALQPGDPAVVELRLPELHSTSVSCPAAECALKLSWSEGGLGAVVSRPCKPGAVHELDGVPTGAPEVECRSGGEAVPLELVPRGTGFALLEPATPLRVDVVAQEGRPPLECEVRIDERVAEAAGEGFWTGVARSGDRVRVVCEGLPAWPVRVGPGQGSIQVDWSRSGPTLDLEQLLPDAGTVHIAADPGEDWLTLHPTDAGVFLLPPLGAGRYRVWIDGTPSGEDTPWPEPGEPGSLALHAIGDSLAGVLVVDRDLPSGRLPVSGP